MFAYQGFELSYDITLKTFDQLNVGKLTDSLMKLGTIITSLEWKDCEDSI